MTNRDQVLLYLINHGNSAQRTHIYKKVFHCHLAAAKLDELLDTELSGLVTIKKKLWVLTPYGFSEANILRAKENAQKAAEEPAPEAAEPIDDSFKAFKAFVAANPDLSPQAALQQAGMIITPPFEDDVELDKHGHPLRYPQLGQELTDEELETIPSSEEEWLARVNRMVTASLRHYSN